MTELGFRPLNPIISLTQAKALFTCRRQAISSYNLGLALPSTNTRPAEAPLALSVPSPRFQGRQSVGYCIHQASVSLHHAKLTSTCQSPREPLCTKQDTRDSTDTGIDLASFSLLPHDDMLFQRSCGRNNQMPPLPPIEPLTRKVPLVAF